MYIEERDIINEWIPQREPVVTTSRFFLGVRVDSCIIIHISVVNSLPNAGG
jgi:hypothetical protein